MILSSQVCSFEQRLNCWKTILMVISRNQSLVVLLMQTFSARLNTMKMSGPLRLRRRDERTGAQAFSMARDHSVDSAPHGHASVQARHAFPFDGLIAVISQFPRLHGGGFRFPRNDSQALHLSPLTTTRVSNIDHDQHPNRAFPISLR
jgi:hypothetical protein